MRKKIKDLMSALGYQCKWPFDSLAPETGLNICYWFMHLVPAVMFLLKVLFQKYLLFRTDDWDYKPKASQKLP